MFNASTHWDRIRGHSDPVKPSVRLVCLQMTLAAVAEF
jgi:hypothetical protein